jgi:hypothetical protein
VAAGIVNPTTTGTLGIAVNSPGDAEVLINSEPDGRTLVRDNVAFIVGQGYDKEDHQQAGVGKVVGALVAPTQKPPNVYLNTPQNEQDAIHGRLDTKSREVTFTPADRKQLGKFVQAMIHSPDSKQCIFSKRKIEEFLGGFCVGEAKSRKWSWERFHHAWDQASEMPFPRIASKCMVKAEAMAECKSPRSLLADGDVGQVFSLICIFTLESLLFDHVGEGRCIKHVAKRDGIQNVAAALTKNGQIKSFPIETDGSAWDATMSAQLRGMIEDPIIRHISKIVDSFGILPHGWCNAHILHNTKTRLKLTHTTKNAGVHEFVKWEIASIRRSGHRGTSCLNYLCNMTLFYCSLFREPQKMLNSEVCNGQCHDGVTRWCRWAGEGDDGLGAIRPSIEGTQAEKDFLEFWRRAGCNMKVLFPKERATFCGYHIQVNGDKTLGTIVAPEVPRCFDNAGVSTSTEAKAAYTSKEPGVAVRRLARCSAYARALEFAPVLPTIARKFLEFGDQLDDGKRCHDREASMRATGEPQHDSSVLRQRVESTMVSTSEEKANLRALQWYVSDEELFSFSTYHWDLDPSIVLNYAAFKASLPAAWRT